MLHYFLLFIPLRNDTFSSLLKDFQQSNTALEHVLWLWPLLRWQQKMALPYHHFVGCHNFPIYLLTFLCVNSLAGLALSYCRSKNLLRNLPLPHTWSIQCYLKALSKALGASLLLRIVVSQILQRKIMGRVNHKRQWSSFSFFFLSFVVVFVCLFCFLGI